MRESTELKETILHEAEELFMAHGFAGTSIKQIATASGCTTAALYYYFPDGKTQILREVVQCSFSAKTTMIVEAGRKAKDLGEWLRAFGHAAMLSILEMQRRILWIQLEMHQLSSAELAVLQQQALLVNQTVAKEIMRFVGDETKAKRLAWLVMCAVFGYGQLFGDRERQQVPGFDIDTFVDVLVSTIGKAAD